MDTETLPTFVPAAWFWVIRGDASRAWSSAVTAYVPIANADTTRTTVIASETELSDVLRPYGLRGPHVSATDVRAEAQRRIIAVTGASDLMTCIVKQLNANMRANELNDKRVGGADLTAAEDAEATALRGLADQIKQIRAASNVMEPSPPSDYESDQHWALE